jgi:hypothetical protein
MPEAARAQHIQHMLAKRTFFGIKELMRFTLAELFSDGKLFL